MTEYPIPVKRLAGKNALTIICEKCHTEAVIGPDDILNDDCYECPANTAAGERKCSGHACMKYWQGDECPGCGKLGYWTKYDREDPLKGCCSRVCMLQVEYRRALRAG